MKKFLFVTIAFLFAMSVFAQDMKKVRNFYDKKDWVKAKEAVDLMLANEKEQKNWEGWYYKGLIYREYGKDPNLKAAIPDVWNGAFDAFQKAWAYDSSKMLAYVALLRYEPVFDNYLWLQREGNDFYNAKDYPNALKKYKDADVVGRFIYKRGWALSAVDTVLYYYAGAAAMQSENMEDAISFFKKICDAGIGGEGYDVCYRYVTYYYDSKKDFATADKYAAVGRKLYPNDTYYDKMELDRERKKGAGPELFAKYETVLNKDAKDYDMRFDYAAELFNWVLMDNKTPEGERETYFNKVVDQLKKCVETDSKKPDAYLLLGKTYFNDAAFLQDEIKKIKGTAPADVQKKNDMKAKMDARMKDAIPNLESAFNIFEGMNQAEVMKDRRMKNEYKSSANLLVEAYRFIGNTEKEKYYQKKYDALNQ
ncbi:MAG: hypothetical protein K2X48_07645 [Chitinophagaceae bacterium]|nr:hypothetical protein [Chitinophagaceae bacterium]